MTLIPWRTRQAGHAAHPPEKRIKKRRHQHEQGRKEQSNEECRSYLDALEFEIDGDDEGERGEQGDEAEGGPPLHDLRRRWSTKIKLFSSDFGLGFVPSPPSSSCSVAELFIVFFSVLF